MRSDKMTTLWERTKKFYEEDQWPLMEREDLGILRSNFEGKNGMWPCVVRVLEEQCFVLFYSTASMKVPEGKHYAAMEFLTRANYGLYIGNFELDLSDGEVRYKTSVDVEGTPEIGALLKQITYANVTTMDRYLPGLMAVCYGNVSPEDAIAMVEQRKQDA
jgi:hypothetical protein